MKFGQLDITALLNQIRDLAILIVSFVLALLLFATSLKAMGHAIPYVPSMDPTPLCYLMGAYYLYRK